MQYTVIPKDTTYKGLSYGDLVSLRANWLFSESPDYQYQSDILHLHGNMHYSGAVSPADDFYDRRGDLEERITTDTAIFIPVMTATYVMGDKYEGMTIENESQLRRAARTDIRLGGAMWAIIQQGPTPRQQQPGNWQDIVTNLNEYMIESPLFKLEVSDRNPFLPHLEVPLDPGTHDAVVVGYFILIKDLNAGRYRIQFGGKGRGNYRTDAIYDVLVENATLLNTSQQESVGPSIKGKQNMGKIPVRAKKDFSS